jgi:thiamine-phosphate pyrophosphorylase
MKPNIDYILYFVTDREIINAEKFEIAVGQTILGGCMVV